MTTRRKFVTLTEREASMVLSHAKVPRSIESICPLCYVLGSKGCDDISGTRREAFRTAYLPNSHSIDVDRLAACIRVVRR